MFMVGSINIIVDSGYGNIAQLYIKQVPKANRDNSRTEYLGKYTVLLSGSSLHNIISIPIVIIISLNKKHTTEYVFDSVHTFCIHHNNFKASKVRIGKKKH